MSRAEELKTKLDRYDDLYYNQSVSEITDTEYDVLKMEYLVLTGQQEYDYVPGGVSPELGRFEHPYPIKSLDKRSSEADLRSELIRLAPGIIEPKYDGLTVVVYPDYEDYDYAHGIPAIVNSDSKQFTGTSRGNGTIGENMTATVAKIDNFDPKAFNKIKAPIRMEAYIKLSRFKELNEERIRNGEKPFENPRNAASGILRQKDVNKVKGITMTAYDIVGCVYKETDKLNLMYRAGIPIPDPKLCFKFTEGNIEDAVQWCLNFDRDALDYEIDGLVIKSNLADSLAKFGETGHHPKNAMAYKFPSQGKWTILKDVTWQVGRTGKLTPVAELDPPVEILGSSIARCTLHNMKYIDTLGLSTGCNVFVVKANDVIPAITKASKDSNAWYETIVEPAICPRCAGHVEKVNDQSFCRNPLCPSKLASGVLHLAKKDSLDIEDLAEGTIQKMIDKGYLQTPTDLFEVTEKQIRDLDGFAAKSAKKLYNNIQKAKRKTPLNRFIYAAGIPGVGRTSSKLIADRFGSFANLMLDLKSGGKELATIDNIGKITVSDMIKYQRLLAVLFMAVTPEDAVKPEAIPAVADGKPVLSFVLTGTMSLPRSEVARRITNAGHIVQDRVGTGTQYLVTGDKVGSTKINAAVKKGVKVVSENEMWRMI